MKEAGVADFDVTSWNALYGPKGMPQQAVDVLARATTEILQRPDVIAQYKRSASMPGRSPLPRSTNACGSRSTAGRR